MVGHFIVIFDGPGIAGLKIAVRNMMKQFGQFGKAFAMGKTHFRHAQVKIPVSRHIHGTKQFFPEPGVNHCDGVFPENQIDAVKILIERTPPE